MTEKTEEEKQKERELLLECFLSEQISPHQWIQHLEADPKLEEMFTNYFKKKHERA